MHTSRHWGWRRLRLPAVLIAAISVGVLLAGAGPATASDPTLYSQADNCGGPPGYGCTSLRSNSVSQAQGADDFYVPASGWHLTGVLARGEDTAAALSSVTVTIYSDSSSSPGAQVYTRMVASGLFNDVADPDLSNSSYPYGDLTIPISVTLPAGHYWLSVAGGSGDEWYWGMRSVAANVGAKWEDPTDSYGMGYTTWTDLATLESTTPGSLDFMFALYGTLPASDELTPTDGAALSMNEGAALNGRTLGTFTDSNTSAVATDFTASIDWGDDTTGTGTVTGSSGNFTVTGSHTFKEEGDYTVVTEVSGNGGTATINTFVHVADAPLTLSNPKLAWKIARMNLDAFATLTVKFTDANRYATADDFTGTIEWWDNGPTSDLTFTAAGGRSWVSPALQQVYARGGTYTITITVNDTGGSTATVEKTFTVR